jgi:hypothetical protein
MAKCWSRGGASSTGALSSVELYDPANNTWTSAAAMGTARSSHTATLLPSGLVLVAGGGSGIASSELYDPATNTWAASANLAAGRSSHSATLMPTGQVLVAGGFGSALLATAERYDVGLGFAAARRPVITTVSTLTNPFAVGFPLKLTGSKFTGDGDASGGGTQNSASNMPLVQLRRLDNDSTQWLTPDTTNPGSPAQYTSAALHGFTLGWYAITMFSTAVPSETKIARLLPVFVVTTAMSPASDGALVCPSPVAEGSPATCTATPNSGFITQSISGCNGTATAPTVNNYTSGGVTADCTVTATFVPIINGVCGTAHTVPTATAPSADLCGYSSVTPFVSSGIGNFGRFNWTCNGSNTGSNVACFAPRLYTITANATPAGTGTLACPGSAVGGATATCTATPNSGHITQSISSGGSGGCGGPPTVPTVNTYTTLSINGNCTVTATFVPIINGACGTAHTLPTFTAPSANLCGGGSAPFVAASPDIFNWTCNGSNTGSNASCSAPRLYTIIASATPAGTGTLACPSSVNGGTTANCVATPNSGFITQSISGCNGAATAPTVNNYTSGTVSAGSTVSGACTVTATFVPIINGACGTAHTLPTFTAPSTNLCGDASTPLVSTTTNNFSWTCNGSNTGSNASCSAPKLYTITASATPAGTGTLACPSSVNGGTTASCVATPDSGFIAQSISGCNGTPTGPAMNNYTSGTVSAACAVTATFVPIINGACGTAHTLPTFTAPSANLCGDASTPLVSTTTSNFSWTCNGSNTGSNASCTAPRQFAISVIVDPAAAGSVSCTPNPALGAGNSACSVTATNAGYAFTGFTGGCTGTTCNLTQISAPVAVTAHFNFTQTITGFTPPASVVIGALPITLSASGGASGNSVTFATSAAPSVCTVSGNQVTFVGAGACDLTANQQGLNRYNAAPQVGKTITINPAAPSLALTGNGTTAYGTSVSFTATLSNAFAATGSVDFRADGATIPGCVIQPVSANLATCASTTLTGGARSITAVYVGDGNNLAATAPAVTHTVNRAAQTLGFGTQVPNWQALVINGTFSLNPAATAGASSSPVSYSAAPSTVCSISGTTLTMLAPGNCVITANQAADANYNAADPVTQIINIVATLDIDRSQANTQYHATTDGVLLVRYLQNLRGAALVTGAVGTTATRADPVAVAAYLDAIRAQLDIDQDGQADPKTDGLLILRYLLGLRGTALTQNALAIAPRVPLRTLPADIEAAIQALMP